MHIEVERQDMYEAMRAEAEKYISELFINMPEEGLSKHDDLAKSNLNFMQASKRKWTGGFLRVGIA